MSTRSHICIVNKDGSIDSIYCHGNGELAWNGLILYNNYQHIDKIRELLAGGDCSNISEEISDVDYYNDGYDSCHYKNMDDYIAANVDFPVDYSYFYDESKNKWSVRFKDVNRKYFVKDLYRELKAQYCLEHTTDKFCCIVINAEDFKIKTNHNTIQNLIWKDESSYSKKLDNFVYSPYVINLSDENNINYYFEPQKLQKYLPVVQKLLNKYNIKYSITLFDENGLQHLGKYQESSDYVKTILNKADADCQIYNMFLEQNEECSLSMN